MPILKYVLEMIPHHMQPLRYAENHSRQKATDEMFASVTYPQDLIYFAKSDKALSAEREAFLWERYLLYCDNKAAVSGDSGSAEN